MWSAASPWTWNLDSRRRHEEKDVVNHWQYELKYETSNVDDDDDVIGESAGERSLVNSTWRMLSNSKQSNSGLSG